MNVAIMHFQEEVANVPFLTAIDFLTFFGGNTESRIIWRTKRTMEGVVVSLASSSSRYFTFEKETVPCNDINVVSSLSWRWRLHFCMKESCAILSATPWGMLHGHDHPRWFLRQTREKVACLWHSSRINKARCWMFVEDRLLYYEVYFANSDGRNASCVRTAVLVTEKKVSKIARGYERMHRA